jgi:hypothetical protein
MTVEVYVWFPEAKKGNFGHAAMKVDGGKPPGPIYLSRWPASVYEVLVGRGANRKYGEDVKREGKAPKTVRLTKLDETAIKSAIKRNLTVNVYSFHLYNCSTQVGLCLREGITGVTGAALSSVDLTMKGLLGIRYSAVKFSSINTPWNLYLFAQSLRPLYS